ncbi:YniB family protein [Burkholderia theae]|uniref:YniB family protein n=1 Tax=Burkholderia theae TaxID=3143496 RepID=UPI003AFB811C
MKLGQARNRVVYMRIVAASLWVISALIFFIGFIKGLYYFLDASSPSTLPPIAQLTVTIKKCIELLYAYTPFLHPIWTNAPLAAPYDLKWPGNYWLIFWAATGFVSQSIWGAASHLNQRIKASIKRVEELGWDQELLRQMGAVHGTKPDVMQINIELDQKDQWYKRPVGLVAIGVAAAVLGQLANLKFGLIH